MDEKLRPCPHCGFPDVFVEDISPDDEPDTDYIIQCFGCGTAYMASEDGMPCSKADLIRRWNRRIYD